MLMESAGKIWKYVKRVLALNFICVSHTMVVVDEDHRRTLYWMDGRVCELLAVATRE